jgi:hypothetical protein
LNWGFLPLGFGGDFFFFLRVPSKLQDWTSLAEKKKKFRSSHPSLAIDVTNFFFQPRKDSLRTRFTRLFCCGNS